MLTANRIHEFLDKYTIVEGLPIILDPERSNGVWVVDMITGKKYLDCTSLFGTAPVGFNHHIMFRESQECFVGVPHLKIPHGEVYTCWYADFIEAFLKKALPDYFKYVVCCPSTDEAIDASLKIAFDWKAKKLGMGDGFAQSFDVIHFAESYHGSSVYALSASDTTVRSNHCYPRFNWTMVPNPKVRFPSTSQVETNETHALIAMKKAIHKGNVAAILMEPLQDKGGNNLFREGFLKQVRDLASESNTLLIFNECNVGFGPSGKWWCHQTFDIRPDLMVFGGRTQVAGVVATEKLDEVKRHCFNHERNRLETKWGGDLADMVRCEIYMQIIEKEDLLKQAKKIGEYMLAKLRELEAVSAKISNTRGIGTLTAFDLPNSMSRNLVLSYLQKHMLIRGCGLQSICFRPPLIFGKEEADLTMDYIRKALIL